MKNFQERQPGGKFHSPGPPADFYLSVKHLSWTGTEREGPRLGHQRCFPWQWNAFGVELSVWSFKGKQLFQKQESATNNMAMRGPCWRCRRLLHYCCVLSSVAKRENTQQVMWECVCVCNKWTRSISWGLFDWADVLHVYMCVFFNECKRFTLHLQSIHQQWQMKSNYVSVWSVWSV